MQLQLTPTITVGLQSIDAQVRPGMCSISRPTHLPALASPMHVRHKIYDVVVDFFYAYNTACPLYLRIVFK